MTAITDPEHIKQFRMLALLSGLRLEVRGLRIKGRSCYQIVKSEFALTGNRRQVLEKYETLLTDRGIKKARTK